MRKLQGALLSNAIALTMTVTSCSPPGPGSTSPQSVTQPFFVAGERFSELPPIPPGPLLGVIKGTDKVETIRTSLSAGTTVSAFRVGSAYMYMGDGIVGSDGHIKFNSEPIRTQAFQLLCADACIGEGILVGVIVAIIGKAIDKIVEKKDSELPTPSWVRWPVYIGSLRNDPTIWGEFSNISVADKYEWRWRRDGDKSFHEPTRNTTETSIYLDDRLQYGSTYCIQVRAVNTKNLKYSAWSSELCAYVFPPTPSPTPSPRVEAPPPSSNPTPTSSSSPSPSPSVSTPPGPTGPTTAPTGVTIHSPTLNSFDIQWNSVPRENGYRISYTRSDVAGPYVKEVDKGVISTKVTGLAPSVRCIVKVQAKENGPWSDTVEITTTSLAKSADGASGASLSDVQAPVNLNVGTITPRRVLLAWSTSPGMKYRIKQNGILLGNSYGPFTTANNTQEIQGLSASTAYVWEIAAEDQSGRQSAFAAFPGRSTPPHLLRRVGNALYVNRSAAYACGSGDTRCLDWANFYQPKSGTTPSYEKLQVPSGNAEVSFQILPGYDGFGFNSTGQSGPGNWLSLEAPYFEDYLSGAIYVQPDGNAKKLVLP